MPTPLMNTLRIVIVFVGFGLAYAGLMTLVRIVPTHESHSMLYMCGSVVSAIVVIAVGFVFILLGIRRQRSVLLLVNPVAVVGTYPGCGCPLWPKEDTTCSLHKQ